MGVSGASVVAGLLSGSAEEGLDGGRVAEGRGVGSAGVGGEGVEFVEGVFGDAEGDGDVLLGEEVGDVEEGAATDGGVAWVDEGLGDEHVVEFIVAAAAAAEADGLPVVDDGDVVAGCDEEANFGRVGPFDSAGGGDPFGVGRAAAEGPVSADAEAAFDGAAGSAGQGRAGGDRWLRSAVDYSDGFVAEAGGGDLGGAVADHEDPRG